MPKDSCRLRMKVTRNLILHLATERSLEILTRVQFHVHCVGRVVIGVFSKENGKNVIGIGVFLDLSIKWS